MKTTDLWFAAFLQLHGIKLKDFVILSRGKGQYDFDISEADWKRMKLLFIQSDVSKIKVLMEQLKDLLY